MVNTVNSSLRRQLSLSGLEWEEDSPWFSLEHPPFAAPVGVSLMLVCLSPCQVHGIWLCHGKINGTFLQNPRITEAGKDFQDHQIQPVPDARLVTSSEH